MSDLLAIDVAILPPPDVAARAMQISASLPAEESEGLRLDEHHLPHVTLSQHFVRAEELDAACAKVEEALAGEAPLALTVTGSGKGNSALWLAVEPSPPLIALHERVMEALRGLERQDGGPGAFFDDDARVRDVLWVTGFRLKSAFGAYTPHITLGHGTRPPDVEPFTFTAADVAVCHLGKFCSCRRVLRGWRLTGGLPAAVPPRTSRRSG